MWTSEIKLVYAGILTSNFFVIQIIVKPDGLRCLSAMKCRGQQRQLCLFLSHILYCILKSQDKYIGNDYSCEFDEFDATLAQHLIQKQCIKQITEQSDYTLCLQI